MSKNKYERLVKITIDSKSISHNMEAFEVNYGVEVAPVLKSNAYGHGLVEVGKIVDKKHIPFICVDTLSEAIRLRNEGVRKAILIIGYTSLKNIDDNKLKNVSFAVMSLMELKRLSLANVKATVHLKVDTGMHRYGLLPEEMEEATNLINQNDNLVLEGVYSHMMDADTENSVLTEVQVNKWNVLVGKVKQNTPKVKYFHIGQTAGCFYSGKLDANVIRLGIGMYGINSGLDIIDLQPALEMRTTITCIKTLKKGESIGYNGTFTAEEDIQIACIPVGYNEGLDRRLSNMGSVLVKGVQCPVIGRVSMNITSIDISHISNVQLDDEVVVISSNSSDENSVSNMAKICKTIPYEILIHISQSLHREVV